MSRNNISEQSLSPTTAIDSSKMGRHDSIHSRQRTFKERSTKATSKRNAKSTTKKRGSRGSDGIGVEEDEAADEEDSSAEQDDDEDDIEDPEVFAPSDGSEVPEDSTQHLKSLDKELIDSKASKLRRAGRMNGSIIATPRNKRTYSETKHDSVLNKADDTSDATPIAYPREKSQRRLSNNHGFLTYDGTAPISRKHSELAIDLSDDEGYGAVDLISDSEDDELSMEKLEERAIVESEFKDQKKQRNKVTESEDEMDLDNMDFSMHLGTICGDSFFSEQMEYMPEEQTMLLLEYGSPSPEPSPTTRKVHFADVIKQSPSSSETSSDTAEIPDIFLEMRVNAPMLHSTPRPNGYDSFNSYSNSDDGSYWDWRDEDGGHSSALRGPQTLSMDFATLPSDIEEGGEADEESSGYDSDSSGDTTDEDMPPPPPPVTTPKATLRSYRPPTRKPTFRHAGRPSRSLPILGQFTLDRSKAVAYRHKSMGIVVHAPKDPSHELARFFPRNDQSSTAQSSPTTPFQTFNADESDFSDASRNPFSGPLDVMFSGLFGGASNQTYNFGGQVIGPPEAFYAFRSVDANGSIFDLDDGSLDDEDDYEDQMNIEDFVQFGVSDDEDDDDVGMGAYVDTTGAEESDFFGPTSPAATEGSFAVTPFRSNSIAGSELMLTPAPSQTMLEHLDRGLITSFRNNQDRAKRLSKISHDHAERTSTSRPIRSGHNANSVITPMRKRKNSHSDALNGKMNGSGAFSSKISKKDKSPRRPKLPPRGFF